MVVLRKCGKCGVDYTDERGESCPICQDKELKKLKKVFPRSSCCLTQVMIARKDGKQTSKCMKCWEFCKVKLVQKISTGF